MRTQRLRSPSHPAERPPRTRSSRRLLGLLVGLLVAPLHAAQVVIGGPPGSGAFGVSVTILPNGNLVVTDPRYDAPGPVLDVGAVYLYRPNGALVSTLRGSSADDRVGELGIRVLANGNYVVCSPSWDHGAAVDAGAVTFAHAETGVNATVSPSNSLVGGSADARIGEACAEALTNGNYVVLSPLWDDGARADVGAATFGNGSTGTAGIVSASNSLVGRSAGDRVGEALTALPNGNFLVRSPSWDNGPRVDAGAVTFGRGTTGVVGAVSQDNSLVGRSDHDEVGRQFTTVLHNGNYVVSTPTWDDDAIPDVGAVTFGSAETGVVGGVSRNNSLVGTRANDRVGETFTLRLANGNYVVRSPSWDNGAVVDAGAATFASGTAGIVGTVSASNSLVGTTASDAIGRRAVALTNGNYVVHSPFWDNGALADAGAATFASGTTGIVGPVSTVNSLVGSSAQDEVGSFVFALTNGNYVVASIGWRNGALPNAGAATFASGTSGVAGVVSPANSLVGTAEGDSVGAIITPLTNGNYVVGSPGWNNGTIFDAGAATFGSGAVGIAGPVSPANSLVGSRIGDMVSRNGVIALSNGNYVVRSPLWDDEAVPNAGAVTFALGSVGIVGLVSATNSLVGRTAEDRVSTGGVRPLPGGNYAVLSIFWDGDAVADAGALTFGTGTSGITGAVSPFNSMIGSRTGDLRQPALFDLPNGNYMLFSPEWDDGAIVDAGAITLGLSNGSVTGPITNAHSILGVDADSDTSFAYDEGRNQLVVGHPAANRVVLHRTGAATSISIVSTTPNPAPVGAAVTFTATVSSAPPLPTDGRVTFTAGSGESCFDATATPTSPTTVEFSCTIAFTTLGTTNVAAEYTGSIIHAYSGSGFVPHTTIAGPLFADGFEGR